MKAISLRQPWASLVVMGHKTIETRSWSTKYRGKLVIHATKRSPVVDDPELYDEAFLRVGNPFKLPKGCVIGECKLLDCVDACWAVRNVKGAEKEILFGDLSPGRFAWILTEIGFYNVPIPAKGAQGFWRWEPPMGHLTVINWV
jgi:hypothetical protein